MNNKLIKEKLQKLEEAKTILKTEYIGIDHIIDKLIQSITPWYVTPEVLNRPQVISLWGITGTGKTSTLKRLFQLIDVTKVACIDSGEISEKYSLSNLINETFSLEESYSTSTCSDAVFIFDEFQHARTIDELGKEINRPAIRQMWNLIDSGTITLPSDEYYLNKVTTFLEDLECLVELNPNIKLQNLIAYDPEDVKSILDTLGFVWFEKRSAYLLKTDERSWTVRRTEGLLPIGEDEIEFENEDIIEGFEDIAQRREGVANNKSKSADPFRPLNIIPANVFLSYITMMNRLDKSLSSKNILDDLNCCTTVSELYQVMSKITSKVGGQKILDFSKSLVLLVGNLDEAFYLSKSVDPDLNADIFKKMIEKNVTIHSIKSALGERFRPEQIARFGNNILKYPAFSSDEFKQIIRLELDRILDRFERISNRKIVYTEDVVDLIYSEGVYPTQGARPILTTIGSIFTPLLSSVIINFPENSEIVVYVLNPEEGYRRKTKTVIFKSTAEKDDTTLSIDIDLIVGSTRNPENNPYRFLVGVHEAGHAVAFAWAFGELPLDIVSTSAKGGGHTTYDPSELATMSRDYVKRTVIVGLAGHSAETTIFNTKVDSDLLEVDRVTVGASQDFEECFSALRDAVYKGGYFLPKRLASLNTSPRDRGLLSGFNDTKVEQLMEEEFDNLYKISQEIVRANIPLIASVAKYIAENGNMSPEQFKEMVDKVSLGGDKSNNPLTLTTELMERRKAEQDFNYYKNTVLNILGEN